MANEKRLIDADALLNAIWDIEVIDYAKTSAEFIEEFDRFLYSIRGLIATAPTVDAVEVVHARWENVQNGKGCCSNCHRLDSIDNLATHCRYCGAIMDGDGNGT